MSGIVSRIGSRSGILNQTEHDIVYSSNVPQPDENIGDLNALPGSEVPFYIDARSGYDSSTNRWHVSGGGSNYCTLNNVSWCQDGPTYMRFTGGSVNSSCTPSSSPRNSYPFSVMAWAWNEDNLQGTDHQIIANCSIGGQRVSIGKGYWDSTKNGMSVMYGGAGHWFVPTTSMGGAFPGWNHLAWNMASSNWGSTTAFINGKAYSMSNAGGTHGGSAGWNFGGDATGNDENWKGKIGEIWVIGKTLSTAEVRFYYNHGKARYQNPKINFRQY